VIIEVEIFCQECGGDLESQTDMKEPLLVLICKDCGRIHIYTSPRLFKSPEFTQEATIH